MQMAAYIEQEGVIAKTVLVIIHVFTIEEERCVARLGNVTVPLIVISRRISYNLKHLELFTVYDLQELIIVIDILFLVEEFRGKHQADGTAGEILKSAPPVRTYI